MTDEPRVATDRGRLEPIAATEPFDEPTRARARRHLREIRAQLHPLLLALRDHPHADDELRDST